MNKIFIENDKAALIHNTEQGYSFTLKRNFIRPVKWMACPRCNCICKEGANSIELSHLQVLLGYEGLMDFYEPSTADYKIAISAIRYHIDFVTCIFDAELNISICLLPFRNRLIYDDILGTDFKINVDLVAGQNSDFICSNCDSYFFHCECFQK